MATTNQKIADLCSKGGFKLPEGLKYVEPDEILIGHGWTFWHQAMPDSAAYDLIAMSFARQARFKIDIVGGNSEAAIDALWKAVCDG